MSGAHPVEILSAMFCVICSMLMLVADASGDHIVESDSSIGLVMASYVAMVVSFCFPHTVDMSALSMFIVLRALLCFLDAIVYVSCCLIRVLSSKEHVCVSSKCSLHIRFFVCMKDVISEFTSEINHKIT